jgi:transposase-like protein
MEGVMAKKRRPHDPSFKARVALEAVRERETISQLSSQYKVHGTQIHLWKRTLLERAAEVFSGPRPRGENVEVSELYQQIGKLQMELEWLKKKSALVD